MKGIFCPECSYPLKLGAHLHLGQRVTCARCETKLIVVNLEPIELDIAIAPAAIPGTKKKTQTIAAPCPECDNNVKISAHAREGQRIKCNGCNSILEVINADPIELDIALRTNSRQNRW